MTTTRTTQHYIPQIFYGLELNNNTLRYQVKEATSNLARNMDGGRTSVNLNVQHQGYSNNIGDQKYMEL
jgi:hypothetical protein